MSCKKCTLTPSLPDSSKKIVLFASHEYMLDKFYENFKSSFDIDKTHSDYLMILSDFQDFISVIVSKKVFTEVELKNISVLPMEFDEPLTFGSYKRSKTLEYFINLYHSDDLKWILDNSSIVTYFQPIVNVKNNEIVAYECLSRGIKRDGTIMPPNVMFESAIKTEMIFNLDRQCRMQALSHAKMKNVNKDIFINFNPTSIYNPEYCLRDTIRCANELNYDFSKVVFEVVESSKVDNIAHLKNIFNFYTTTGFRVALDDVGSGYSSLNMLADLKPGIIKIDMELVRDVSNNPTKKAIINSLVYIAREINALTLAEGIETREELETIKMIGVDMGQGYLFGKPSPEPIQ